MSKATDKEKIKELEKSVIFILKSLTRIAISNKRQDQMTLTIANKLGETIDWLNKMVTVVKAQDDSMDSVQKTMEKILGSLQKTRKTLTSATDIKVAENPKQEQKPKEFYVA